MRASKTTDRAAGWVRSTSTGSPSPPPSSRGRGGARRLRWRDVLVCWPAMPTPRWSRGESPGCARSASSPTSAPGRRADGLVARRPRPHPAEGGGRRPQPPPRRRRQGRSLGRGVRGARARLGLGQPVAPRRFVVVRTAAPGRLARRLGIGRQWPARARRPPFAARPRRPDAVRRRAGTRPHPPARPPDSPGHQAHPRARRRPRPRARLRHRRPPPPARGHRRLLRQAARGVPALPARRGAARNAPSSGCGSPSPGCTAASPSR